MKSSKKVFFAIKEILEMLKEIFGFNSRTFLFQIILGPRN
jgi:hypothetical protein